MNTADEEIAAALRWITEIMAGALARYQAVGGLAARAYGARRPLADLDFYLPARDLARVLKELGPHGMWGPEHFRDDCWDLTFARVE